MANKFPIWILIFAWILTFGFLNSAYAETSLNGYIKLDERVFAEDAGEYSWNRATLGLKVKNVLSEQVAGYGEMKIRTQDFPSVSSASDLTSKSNVTPVSMELYEAYVDAFDFPFLSTDFRAGKQRIAWGTADRLNQVDNLNPYDFSDLLEFGKKLPTNALKLTAFPGDTILTFAMLPVFTPAVMPSSYNSSIVSDIEKNIPAGISLATYESRVTLPESKFENSMFAAKLSRNILGYDMSLSYFSGRDSIPNMANLTVELISPTQVSAVLTQNYPKIQVIGYDLAGSLGGFGVWGEVAHFMPHDLVQEVILPPPFTTTTTEVKAYTKYTLGFDYTFENGFYLNSQLMHGFFDERGKDLSDLIMTRIEKKLFNEKVKVALTWLGEYDQKIIGNLFDPQITWYPADATEVQFGSFSIHGEAGSKLATWQTLDQIYLRVKYSF